MEKIRLKYFFAKLSWAPRKFRKLFYIKWNQLLFWLWNIDFGVGMEIYNKVYLSICPGAKVCIGNNFRITSGEAFNPLCRNLRAAICAERPTTVIEIGNDTGMSSPCIWAKERIIIGNRVKIGGDCILMDSDAHNLDFRIRGSKERIGQISKDILTAKTSPIIIDDDVLIGTRCIILKGVTIGKCSIIAAGSIVTKSIPANCIAGGNPCKVIHMLDN